MKAFLHAMWDNGTNKLGTDHAAITNEYKSLRAMKQYAIIPFIKRHGNCHAEIFYNWDNRYGKADIDVRYDENGRVQ